MHRPGTMIEHLRRLLDAEEQRQATRGAKRLRMLASITADELAMVTKIVEESARDTKCKREIRNSRARTEHVCFTRQIAMHLTRELTNLSWNQIGAYFDRHHTTVIHGYREIASRQIDDPLFKQTLFRIASAVRQSSHEVAA